MLRAVGKARLTWGVTIGGLGAIPASVCAGYDPGLRREDRIHSSRYPAAPPLQPCSHFGPKGRTRPLLAALPRPNERPGRLGTVPPATPSPPVGWWARPGVQPPTPRHWESPPPGLRDPRPRDRPSSARCSLCSRRCCPAKGPASQTCLRHHGAGQWPQRRAQNRSAPAHTEPGARPPEALELQFLFYPCVPCLRTCSAP